MKWEPKQYQSEALDFVLEHADAGCALWKEMGLGKTSVAASALAQWFDRGEVGRALVVAPKRVCLSVWPQEVAKWDHLNGLPVRQVEGSQLRRSQMLDSPYVGIECITYEKLLWLFGQHLRGRGHLPWQAVIFDESSKLKAVSTRRFRTLRRWAAMLPKTIELTGSPAPQSLLDVWAPIYLLDQGQRLGRTFTSFRDRWFTQADYMGWRWTPRAGTDKVIAKRLSDIVLSMRAQDYLDLPDLLVNDVVVDMPRSALGLYKELEDEMFLRIENDEVEAANGGVLTNKCRQLANGFLYVNGSDEFRAIHNAKYEALDDIIEENGGKPLLVAYQFKADLAAMQARYPRATVYAHAKDPVALEEQWNAGKVEMLLIHPGSAGHGLNLQGGTDTLVMFGLGWSNDQYEQTLARIAGGLRRQRPVIVHRILTRATVDLSVREALQTNSRVQDVLKREVQRRRRPHLRLVKG